MNRVCFGGAEELFMERINVDVSDLCLWETNPRVEPSIDQMDELNKIYITSAHSLNRHQSGN